MSKLILHNVRRPNEFPVGNYQQQQLIQILKDIWENQLFLSNQDLEELSQYGK